MTMPKNRWRFLPWEQENPYSWTVHGIKENIPKKVPTSTGKYNDLDTSGIKTKDFLDKLEALIALKVKSGKLTQEQADALWMNNIDENRITLYGITPDIPFHDEVMGFYAPEIQETQRMKEEKAVADFTMAEQRKVSEQDYVNQANERIPAGQFRGLRYGEEADTAIRNANLGAVQQYRQGLQNEFEGQRASAIDQFNDQPRDWVSLWFAEHRLPSEQLEATGYKLPQNVYEEESTGLATPKWLPKYIDGQEGQPLQKKQVTTPSPQQWNLTAPLEKQRLAGYMDFATGIGSYEGMLQSMESMIPTRNPNRPQWKYARQ